MRTLQLQKQQDTQYYILSCPRTTNPQLLTKIADQSAMAVVIPGIPCYHCVQPLNTKIITTVVATCSHYLNTLNKTTQYRPTGISNDDLFVCCLNMMVSVGWILLERPDHDIQSHIT